MMFLYGDYMFNKELFSKSSSSSKEQSLIIEHLKWLLSTFSYKCIYMCAIVELYSALFVEDVQKNPTNAGLF